MMAMFGLSFKDLESLYFGREKALRALKGHRA
jgi:hypothetical protein